MEALPKTNHQRFIQVPSDIICISEYRYLNLPYMTLYKMSSHCVQHFRFPTVHSLIKCQGCLRFTNVLVFFKEAVWEMIWIMPWMFDTQGTQEPSSSNKTFPPCYTGRLLSIGANLIIFYVSIFEVGDFVVSINKT